MDRRTLESSHDRNARRNSARLDEMDDAIIDYAINFKMVLKASKFETIESLMKHYREIEQENFVRFMVIVDMNHEVRPDISLIPLNRTFRYPRNGSKFSLPKFLTSIPQIERMNN